ncbi:MAG: tryptophan-rich sensory protein [Chloroflexi bacterium]|jgi:benzodiazapine receptor|nr:tryptophan-rich sensory protein [Chloroflexota bacterium]
MGRVTLRQWLIVLAVVATIVVNVLANALPFNNKSTAEISDSFDVYFVPAGYVFAIWGLIYVGLLAYAVYQALPGRAGDPVLRSIALPFGLASVGNIAWLFLWHYLYIPWTLLAMLLLLGALLAIYLRLGAAGRPASAAERWCLRVPFSVYLGWITVATIANVTDVLDWVGWGGWGIGPLTWAVIILVVATAIAALVAWTRRDVAYEAVIVWALVGIAVAQADARAVAIVAGAMAVLVAVVTVLSLRRAAPSAA